MAMVEMMQVVQMIAPTLLDISIRAISSMPQRFVGTCGGVAHTATGRPLRHRRIMVGDHT